MEAQKYKRHQEDIEQKRLTARAESMEDKQMQLLDAEIANLGSGGMSDEARKQASDAATEYLGKWNSMLDQSQGVFSTAISELGKAGELIDRSYSSLGDLDEIGSDIKTEWDTFKQDFGGTQKRFLDEAGQSLTDRGTLRRSFMDLAKGDYEGESSRAMTDVAGKAEQGRQAEAMRMQGLGIDPTSGRARTFMQESRDREGLSQVMAGNKARLEEKERVAGITAEGLSLIDPTKDLAAASQIQGMSANLLSQRSNLATTKAGLATDLARSRTDVGRSMTNVGANVADVGSQYGEFGAAQLGVSQSGSATTPSGGGAVPTDFAALQKKTSDIRKQFYG
jgi:hypothetical protein